MMDFGITGAQFRERYFEKRPWLFRGALAQRSMSWARLDELLYQIEPTPAGMRLFHRGLVPAEDYVQESIGFGQRRRRLNKIRFYGHMRSGATLVINRLETHCAEARRLCIDIARFTGQPTTGNAYLSFTGDGTFGRHWDTHDVFAVQLIGRKRWLVFEPTLPLPLSHQVSDRSETPCPATPVMDCVLETGDVLYLPRGWWHQVIPLHEGSLHFSVGAYAPTVQDYLSWLCSRVVPDQIEGRIALDTASGEQLAAMLRAFGAAAVDPRFQEEFIQSVAAKDPLIGEFNTDLFLNQRMPVLGENARLRLNTRAEPDVHGRMLIDGAALQLDAVSATIVRTLASVEECTLDALSARLREVPRDSLHRSVLDLIGREVLAADDLSR